MSKPREVSSFIFPYRQFYLSMSGSTAECRLSGVGNFLLLNGDGQRACSHPIRLQEGWKRFDELADEFRIEGFSRLLLNIGRRLFDAPGFAIGTIGAERIPDIDDGKNSCGERDRFPLEPIGIP